MGAVPVPGTSWVRILLGYRCMRTPGVPLFVQKKIFRYGSGTGRVGSDTGWVQAGTKTGVVSTRFLLLSYSILSLFQAKPFDSLSHFLTLPTTGYGRCFDCGLAAAEGAPIVDLRRGRCSDFDFSSEYENTGVEKRKR